jgi:uncharacterized membrane protein (UPF0127 family)
MFTYVKILFLCVVLSGISSCQDSSNLIKIGDSQFYADYAVTDQEKSNGLMFVETLDDDYAMIFLNNAPQYTKFWMKNTLIPLDMLFFDSNNNLIHIEHNAVPHDLSLRGPNKPICTVIEIKGGLAKTQGIQVGDKLFHNPPHLCLQ